MGTAKKKLENAKTPFEGIQSETVKEWYQITHLGRLIETQAGMYIRKAKG